MLLFFYPMKYVFFHIMKKTQNYLKVILLLIVISFDKPAMAQEDVVKPFSSAFFKKQIHYTEIPQDVFNAVIQDSDKLRQYESMVSAGYFRESGGVVEVKSGNDIYTWPIALSSYDKDIVFYAQGVNPRDRNYEVVVHGMHVSIALANLNMLKIGEQTTSVFSCFDEPNADKAELVIPEQYVVVPDEDGNNNMFLLSYTLTFSEVASVIYTEPKYTVVAGQLFEVNDGVNYDVQMYDVAGLSLFDTRTMKAVPNTTIHLKGISTPRLRYSKNHIYYYDLSEYRIRYQDGSHMNSDVIGTMSQAGTPIYLLNVDQSQIIVESQIHPEDGDVVCDLQETSKYICYCGSNKKHGYVGYENPVLVVIDKDSKKAVARYNGNHGEGRKDRFFNKMYVLDDDHILLMYNDYHYGTYMSSMRYEIVSLSSIVSDFGMEGIPSISNDEDEQMEYDEASDYHIDFDGLGEIEYEESEQRMKGWGKYGLIGFALIAFGAILVFVVKKQSIKKKK